MVVCPRRLWLIWCVMVAWTTESEGLLVQNHHPGYLEHGPGLVVRRALVVDEATALMAKTKKELVAMCREASVKVSGTKAELVERLLEQQGGEDALDPAQPAATVGEDALDPAQPADSVGEEWTKGREEWTNGREASELAEAKVDVLIDELAASKPEAADPSALLSKADALLAEGGGVFARVRKRRLAAADQKVRAAIALLDGFVAGLLRTRSRDTVRYVLKAATESSEAIDAVFKALHEAGHLDAALESYVDGLLSDKRLRSGPDAPAASNDDDDLLSRVLLVIKDRVKAERHVAQSKELRILARALQFDDHDRRRDFLDSALATSLEFSTSFHAYVRDALAFVDATPPPGDIRSELIAANNPDAPLPMSQAQRDALRDIERIVADIRASMPV